MDGKGNGNDASTDSESRHQAHMMSCSEKNRCSALREGVAFIPCQHQQKELAIELSTLFKARRAVMMLNEHDLKDYQYTLARRAGQVPYDSESSSPREQIEGKPNGALSSQSPLTSLFVYDMSDNFPTSNPYEFVLGL